MEQDNQKVVHVDISFVVDADDDYAAEEYIRTNLGIPENAIEVSYSSWVEEENDAAKAEAQRVLRYMSRIVS